MTPEQVSQVRALNDAFRTIAWGDGGRTVLTQGIDAKGLVVTLKVLRAVRAFAAFNEDNDPFNEHDFGSVEVDGEIIFFKLSYFASGDMDFGSDAPWDADLTTRVLTIMLASDY